MSDNNKILPCPICGRPLAVRPARGRKSHKLFLMLVCTADGRHFRGFIHHPPYIEAILRRASIHDPGGGSR